jgi:hypothetical protein
VLCGTRDRFQMKVCRVVLRAGARRSFEVRLGRVDFLLACSHSQQPFHDHKQRLSITLSSKTHTTHKIRHLRAQQGAFVNDSNRFTDPPFESTFSFITAN